MPSIPTVTISVQDNGASAALAVAASNIQLVVGCAVGGTVNQPFATTNPTAIQTNFIGGPLVESAGLVAQAGNVALCVSAPIVTKGTVTAVVPTVPGGSTSTLTVTADTVNGAWDDYYVMVKCVTGGTIGTAPGPTIQVSLDAGRNWGTPISLGAATTLVLGAAWNPVTIGGTGLTLNFAAGNQVAGDFWRFSSKAPTWNDAGIQAAIAAFMASQYAVAGVGSIHIVGAVPINGGSGNSDITTVHTALNTGTNGYVYERAILEAADAYAPVAWGGSADTEVAWMGRLTTIAAGSTAQPRITLDAGHYNTPSPYASPAGGLPAYRRPGAWSHAVRRTQVPLQRRAGRVKDNPLSTIVVSPAVDPTDGFVYHDERVNPGLNTARIGSMMTWPKKGAGFFVCQEPLLSAPGSQFVELVIGNVLDAACNIVYAAGAEYVSDDLLLTSTGALDPVALKMMLGNIQQALNQGMVATPLVSSVTASISPVWNVGATGQIPVVVSVMPRGYVNAVVGTVTLNVA